MWCAREGDGWWLRTDESGPARRPAGEATREAGPFAARPWLFACGRGDGPAAPALWFAAADGRVACACDMYPGGFLPADLLGTGGPGRPAVPPPRDPPGDTGDPEDADPRGVFLLGRDGRWMARARLEALMVLFAKVRRIGTVPPHLRATARREELRRRCDGYAYRGPGRAASRRPAGRTRHGTRRRRTFAQERSHLRANYQLIAAGEDKARGPGARALVRLYPELASPGALARAGLLNPKQAARARASLEAAWAEILGDRDGR